MVKENKLKAVTTHLNLSELTWTLLTFYKLPKDKVILSIRSINNLRGIDLIDFYEIHTALSIFESKNVKFIDAMIASIKEVQGHEFTIVSYDKDFDKIGVLRKEPSEISLKD